MRAAVWFLPMHVFLHILLTLRHKSIVLLACQHDHVTNTNVSPHITLSINKRIIITVSDWRLSYTSNIIPRKEKCVKGSNLAMEQRISEKDECVH